MSFSALYEEIARTISSTYGVPYADVLKACQRVEKSSVGISKDTESPEVPKGKGPKGKVAKPEKKVHDVCQHIFQRGKNKNAQCTRAVRDGSDRCSSHGGTSHGGTSHGEEIKNTYPVSTDPVSDSHQESHQESDEEVVVDKKKSKKKIPNKKP
jgi:hypothetical protein